MFEDKHFSSRVKTEHGRVDVLQKFTKKSKLLSGLENYRVAILEVNPQTFIAPTHFDADIVLFVANGMPLFSHHLASYILFAIFTKISLPSTCMIRGCR